MVASLAVGAAAAHGAAFVNPWSGGSVTAIATYAGAVRWTAVLQLGSAVPLAIYACTASARLHRLGVRAPGATIALGGGLWSALMLALSAMTTFALTWPASSTESAGMLRAFAFATGGVGMVVGLGLLLAGISVPALVVGLLPRPVATLGLVLAVVSELTFLALAVEPMSYLLPVGRFVGIAWLVAAGFWLPIQRQRRTDAAA